MGAPIRYLYSPLADDFVSLLNYENDAFYPAERVANWERRLSYDLTDPNNTN